MVSVSRTSIPSTYPPAFNLQSNSRVHSPIAHHPQPLQVQSPEPYAPPVHIPQQPPVLPQIPDDELDVEEENEVDAPNPEELDFEQLLDDLLHIPGREQLLTWFNRDKGKLTRVIAGIFRHKFDGPYYSWKVTPVHIQERYFRTFAKKYNWEIGITATMREHFLRIAKNHMKGIVSQAKNSGARPYWISRTLWNRMWQHWNTTAAQERSAIASQSRNSNRNGLGVHKHVSGQKSYLRIQQEIEEELGRPVSLGEVFLRTHTTGDGTFVYLKAQEVVAAYEKHLTGSDGSQHSTHRTLSIVEKNEIFLHCTQTDERGNPFGLGQMRDTVQKGKRKESYASSSSSSFTEMQAELQEAKRTISEQARENARRDELVEASQSRLQSFEKLFEFMKATNSEFAAYAAQSDVHTHETSPTITPTPPQGNSPR